MFRKLIFFSIFVAVLALASAPVHADTLTVNDVLFTATVTSTDVTLTVQCTDNSVCGGYFLGNVGLKGFTFTGDPTNITEPTNYAVQNGGVNNGQTDPSYWDLKLGVSYVWKDGWTVGAYYVGTNNTGFYNPTSSLANTSTKNLGGSNGYVTIGRTF